MTRGGSSCDHFGLSLTVRDCDHGEAVPFTGVSSESAQCRVECEEWHQTIKVGAGRRKCAKELKQFDVTFLRYRSKIFHSYRSEPIRVSERNTAKGLAQAKSDREGQGPIAKLPKRGGSPRLQ